MPCRHWLVPVALIVGLVQLAPAAAPDLDALLRDADRFAWLTNWGAAGPIYASAEKAALAAGDRRSAAYARFGRLRSEMQTLPLGALSEQLAGQLAQPLVANDARLRLRGLTVKGDVDLEWDVVAALRGWQQVRELAKRLRDAGWENRANGELGMIAFIRGNTGEAKMAVQQAMDTARKLGDVGGELRYLSAIGNGLLLAGYPQIAAGYVDRALALAHDHPDTGFPFVATSTKVLILIALKQYNEAERFAQSALAEARVGDRRIKEIELHTMLARIAEARQQPTQVIEHLETARMTAQSGQVHRLLAAAESSLARAYRKQGDLIRAAQRASSAVNHTRTAGSRFTLPTRLGELAAIRAAQDRLNTASALYSEASDIVEGIMANVPSRTSQARLVGVMSELYAGNFVLAADRLNEPFEAFRVIERARGRALADVLRTLPGDSPSMDADARARTVSALQVRLMTARSAAERSRLLDRLWEAEQLATTPASPLAAPRARLPSSGRAAAAAVQKVLRPREILLEFVLLPSGSYCFDPDAIQPAARPTPRPDRDRAACRSVQEEVQAGRVNLEGVGEDRTSSRNPRAVEPASGSRERGRGGSRRRSELHSVRAARRHRGEPGAIGDAGSVRHGAGVDAGPAASAADRSSGPGGRRRAVPTDTRRETSHPRLPSAFFDAAMPPSLPSLAGSADEARAVASLL